MSEEELAEKSTIQEIDRYVARLKTEYSTSIEHADPDRLRRINILIHSHALKQYQEHWDRFESGGIRISDGR